MVLDPRLKAGMMNSGSRQHRVGCELLEEYEPCDDTQRKCTDVFCAILFYLAVGAVCCVSAHYSDKAFELAEDGWSNYDDYHHFQRKAGQWHDQVESGEVVWQAVLATTAGGLVAFVTTTFFYSLAKRFPGVVVWSALLVGPVIVVVIGLVAISFYPDATRVGVVCIVVGIAMASMTICCWRHLVSFTIVLIKAVAGVVQEHVSMIGISVVGAFLSLLWSLLCVFAFSGVYAAHRLAWKDNADSAPTHHACVYFGLLWVFLWGSSVAVNTCHVACCGVVGRWYFNKEMSSAVSLSLKAAFSTSFGPICFGSAVVTFMRALKIALKQARDSLRDNAVLQVILCCLEAVISCLKDFMETFNSFAYVQVAVRGLGFIKAARATFALCTFANCHLISSDVLVGTVTGFAVIIPSLLGSGTAFKMFQFLHQSTHNSTFELGCALAGFIISFVVASAVLQPLAAGATTLLVCWAENPRALQRSNPELAQAFNIRGNNWCGDDEPAAHAVSATELPLGVSQDAFASPMLEGQASSAGRLMAVTVPDGVTAGQTVQIQSPEGQLFHVVVPPGYSPGTVFTAEY
eukprot:TRINITY_DN33368_c0_g1_i1.p1 TRINITY_DN33368_c0_g1~~TRINITY_DN33368_c0_g1_i1.p1  ORF type:complete len:575 (+),score=61.32 TRINITY_DN33368_c0_g1_i1:96-1820(+)